MAEIDPTELVTIKREDTGETRQVARVAVPFFPDYVVLKSDGSVNPHPATPAKKD